AVNPDTVVVIGNAVFNGKTSLTSVTLSNNLEVIFRSAFRNCNHLTEIIIPETVMYISGYAFSGCGSLINIYMDGYIPPIIYDTTFNSSSFNIWIYGESYNDYTSADVWVDLYTLIQLRD
ncbi:MAG: leucine-rich repeat domain-containing protein, partial [Candidatus Izemoplasmatales bacterium]